MFNDVLIVRIGEIHLKGLNRGYFINRLEDRVKKAVYGLAGYARFTGGYIYVKEFTDGAAVIASLSGVFGIQSISPAIEAPKTYEAMLAASLRLIEGRSGAFKVQSKRSDKSFPIGSMDLSGKLGGDILEARPDLTVNVREPDFIVHAEVREKAYIFVEKIPGPGGMPLGTGGKACLLLSGGIDSPVAGYQIARRGVSICAVYFDGFPYTSEKARQKAADLAERLRTYIGGIRLYNAPFAEIQQAIRKQCPDNYTTIIMRRFMMRVAERVATHENALALVTGESIGQVASQTLHAIQVTDNAASMPIFRPLIGFDKLDIINIAKTIGTYDISTRPYDDCCSVFTPRHPTTRPKLETALAIEADMDVEGLTQSCYERALGAKYKVALYNACT